MILKSYEIEKIKNNNHKFYLLYGENEGFKEEVISKIKFKYLDNVFFYEESEIIKEKNKFLEEILNTSLFENKKLIIISRSTDKIFNIIEEITKKEIKDIIIILKSGKLEKKSKIRIFFEKNANTVCIPFYEDNAQTLGLIAKNFIKEKNINLSQQNINFIVDKARGDRLNLKNELEKIELLSITKKRIDIEHILKLSNLAENYSFSELADNYLSKNKKKIIKILNENNFSHEDCILVLRIFLLKIKRLINLKNYNKITKNIDEVITQYKPPIFWKDKEIIKQQIKHWTTLQAKNLLIEVNNIELLIKKEPQLALITTTNFILDFKN